MPPLKILTIARKELKEYVLKPGSISWGLVFPIVFTLAFIVRFGDIDHVAPGLVSISIVFGTTSFVASSVIFERKLRTFERLLVAPVSYVEIILAKLLVGSLFGLFVAMVSLALVSRFMVYRIWNLPLVVGYSFLGGLAFSALALMVSLAVENPISAMTWLNLIRLPMMFTSGAIASLLLFPRWFLIAGYLTPMTYLVEGLRFSMLKYAEVVHPVYSALVLIFMTLLFTYLSAELLRRLY
ncbi:ABC transporter permease [Thermococcus sp.]